MENLSENIENKNSKMNDGIKEERLKALKEKYQKPELVNFAFDHTVDSQCSDMASPCGPGITM